MRSAASRVAAFFVGPELMVRPVGGAGAARVQDGMAVEGVVAPGGGGVPPGGVVTAGDVAAEAGGVAPAGGAPQARGTRRQRSTGRRRVPGRHAPAVAVLGAGAAALAVDLAAALAQRGRHPVALTAVWGASPPAPPRGQAVRPAERLAAALEGLADVPAPAAGGDGVVVCLPEDPDIAVAALAAAEAAVAGEGPVVLAVCGPRPAAFDALLAARDVLVPALPDDAPPMLAGVAAVTLGEVAPGARVVPVVLPGSGLPRPFRHRSVVRQVLEAWDA
jgi:hypothetical protein